MESNRTASDQSSFISLILMTHRRTHHHRNTHSHIYLYYALLLDCGHAGEWTSDHVCAVSMYIQ